MSERCHSASQWPPVRRDQPQGRGRHRRESIEQGADAQAAIGAAVITASDFAQLMFGEEALDDLKATLEMQRGKSLPKVGS